jgi:hypothetical protein
LIVESLPNIGGALGVGLGEIIIFAGNELLLANNAFVNHIVAFTDE